MTSKANKSPSPSSSSSDDKNHPELERIVTDGSIPSDPSFGRDKAGHSYWPHKVKNEMEHAVENVKKEVGIEEKDEEKEKPRTKM